MLHALEHYFHPNSEAFFLEKNKLNQNIENFMLDILKVVLQELILVSH